jgi:heme oxygenase
MYDIKELTAEIHQNAERQEFVKTLMSGSIDPNLYATYLYNQLQCYSVLEKYGMENSLFRTTPNLPRGEHIHYDYKALWTGEGKPTITQSTKDYVAHIETIKEDAEKLYAHIYTRYLGDISGGQMIMRKTPGPNRYYKFKHKEIKDYKRIVREMINSYLNVYQLNILNECKFCFASATALFKEMNDMDTSKPLILNNEVFDEKNRDTENDPFKGTSIEGRD